MSRVLYLNDETAKGMRFVEYKEANFKGEFGCDLCGKGLKHLYIISNGKDFSIVGSECVKTIAEIQHRNTLEGIDRIPTKHRKAVKINKCEWSDDELPF